MTAALVSLAACKTFLGLSVSTHDTLLQTLLDDVEALFLVQSARDQRPFQAAEAARTEVHDGTGLIALHLDYPIEDLTSVLIGQDPADPDETLDVDDRAVLLWQVGRSRIVRADGGTFGQPWSAESVHVTYNAAADLPGDAALAVQRVVATLFRQLGSEDAGTERVGGYSVDYLQAVRDEPLWAASVGAHRVPCL